MKKSALTILVFMLCVITLNPGFRGSRAEAAGSQPAEEAAVTAAAVADGAFTYEINPDGTTATLTGYTGTDSFSELPSVIDGYPVNAIQDNAFKDCAKLTGDITIPDGVTAIGENAFYNCKGLTGAAIPGSVVSIGHRAFYGCTAMTRAEIPACVVSGSENTGNTYKGTAGTFEYVFGSGSYTAITEVVILEGTKTVGANAFNGLTKLTGVTVPGSVTKIGAFAFYGCTNLAQDLVIPAGVTEIGTYAFYNCKKLTGDLILPAGITRIEPYSFYSCSALNGSLSISSRAAEIGEYAFNGCSGLTGDLVLPNGLTSIGDRAFYNCRGLTGDVVVPDGVTVIPENAFNNCAGLTGITLPANVSVGYRAFYGCTGMKKAVVPCDVVAGSANSGSANRGTAGTFEYVFGTGSNNGITEVVITGSPETIGNNAFYGQTKLKSVVLPDSVTQIGDYAFSGCTGLEQELVIPAGVTQIGTYAFYNCQKLTGSLILPEGVTRIEPYAFYWCSGLTGNLSIPAGLEEIGEYAFYNCKGLTGGLTLPAGLTEIGAYAFNSCQKLTGELVIPESITEIPEYAFCFCSGFSGVVIPDSVVSVGTHAFYACIGMRKAVIPACVITGSENKGTARQGDAGTFAYVFGTDSYNRITEVVISENTKTIGASAFSGCGSLKTALIPAGVTVIEPYAFHGCTALVQELVLPAGLTEIGASAFHNCKKLTGELSIPAGVTKIGQYAFYFCSGLTGDLILPDVLTQIGRYAFFNCGGLTGDLEIPAGLTDIPENVFCKCSGLTGVLIPDSVESIGHHAFYGCTGMKKAVIPSCAVSGSEQPESRYQGTAGTFVYIFGSEAYNGIQEVILPDGTETIGSNAFSGCNGLKSIRIPESVSEIGAYAFNNCRRLEGNLEISDRVTTIGNDAFAGCSSLASITLPANLRFLGANAFHEFYGNLYCALQSDSARMVSANGFNFCLKGEENYRLRYVDEELHLIRYTGNAAAVEIPDSVEVIHEKAFSIGSLVRVYVPESVVKIEARAFEYCQNLKYVYLPRSIEAISDSSFLGIRSTPVFYVYSDTYPEEYALASGYKVAYLDADLTVRLPFAMDGGRLRVTAKDGKEIFRDFSGTEVSISGVTQDCVYDIALMNTYGDTLAEEKSVYADSGMNVIAFAEICETGSVKAVVRGYARRNLTDSVTIRWFDEQGKDYAEGSELNNVPAGKNLTYRVRYNADIMPLYAEQADQNLSVCAGEQYLNITLPGYEMKSVSGRVTEPVNANLSILQCSEVTGTVFTTELTTEPDGTYRANVPALAAQIVISAEGYKPQTLELGAADTLPTEVSLIPLDGIRIDVVLEMECAGSADTVVIPLASTDRTLTNRSTGKVIEQYVISGESLYITSGASAGDELTLCFKGDAFSDTSAEVGIPADRKAEVRLTAAEKGSLRLVIDAEDIPEARLGIYDSNGLLVSGQDFAGQTVLMEHLNAGEYTAVVMEAGDFIGLAPQKSAMAETAHAEYGFVIRDREITRLSVESIPPLDESAYYAAEAGMKISRPSVAVGRRYTISTAATVLNPSATDFAWIFELPESSVYVDGTAMNGSQFADCESSGNRLIVHTADPSEKLRLCLMPTNSGKQTVKGYLRYTLSGKTCRQKLGSVSLEAEPLRILVAEKTYTKRIYVRGQASTAVQVRILDNEVCVCETAADVDGLWSAWIELNETKGFGLHRIYAEYTCWDGRTCVTESETVLYRYMEEPVSISRVRMYYQKPEDPEEDYCAVFDFDNPENTSTSYTYRPKRTIHFIASLNGNTDRVTKVKIVVSCTDGSVKMLPAEYDPDYGAWYASAPFETNTAPVGISVQYNLGLDTVIDDSYNNYYSDLEDLLAAQDDGFETIDTEGLDEDDAVMEAIDRYNAALLACRDALNQSAAGYQERAESFLHGGYAVSDCSGLTAEGLKADGFTEAVTNSGSAVYYKADTEAGQYILVDFRNRQKSVFPMQAAEIAGFSRWMEEQAKVLRRRVSEFRTSFEELLRYARAKENAGEDVVVMAVHASSIDSKFWAVKLLALWEEYGTKITDFLPFDDLDRDFRNMENNAKRLYELRKLLLLYPQSDELQSSVDDYEGAAGICFYMIVWDAGKGFVQIGCLIGGNFFPVLPDIYTEVSATPGPVSSSMIKDVLQTAGEAAFDVSVAGTDSGIETVDYPADGVDECPSWNFDPFVPITPVIDPSGYVYEAVPSNRVPDVTATLIQQVTQYDMYDEPFTEEIVWNAAEYGQTNPQITNENGEYGWDVPDGLWKVTFTKDGYVTKSTQWMAVPPERKDVNIELVSNDAPEVILVNETEDGYRIQFSKYMVVSDLNSAVTVLSDGQSIPVELEFPGAQKSTGGVLLSDTVLVHIEETDRNLTLKIRNTAHSYKGISMAEDYIWVLTQNITEMRLPEEITVDLNTAETVVVKLYPAEQAAGRIVTVESSRNSIARSSRNIVVNEDGEARVRVEGFAVGETSLTFTVSDSSVTGSMEVRVRDPIAGLTAFVLPNALKTIDSDAFVNTAAEVIIIPESCEYIADGAFADCPNLRYIVNYSDVSLTAGEGVTVLKR